MAKWTIKLTFPEDARDDWVVRRDGLVVGRVYRDRTHPDKSCRWCWSVLTLPTASGHTKTLSEALGRVRELASDEWAHEPDR